MITELRNGTRGQSFDPKWKVLTKRANLDMLI